MAPTRVSDNGVKKRRSKPPVKGKNGASASQIKKPAAAANNGTKKKPGKGPGKELRRVPRRKTVQEDEEEEEDELSIIAPTQAQSSQPRKRRSYVEADQIADEPTKTQEKKYMQLEMKTKRIPQEIIETWPELPQLVLEQIGTVIKDAKKDIANTQRDERKVMAAHNTLNPLVKKLVRQLAGSKIPPHARDTHFNIDKLTERNGQAFQDVTTARHSKQLLSEQVKVAQVLLKKDEESLEDLKKNAKEWKAEWKHQQRHGRVHPLLGNVEDANADGDGPDDIRLKPSAAIDTYALDAPGAELAPILEQLRRSLKNIQGNYAQVEGISEAVIDAQTALDEVLFRHAGAQQYATL